MNEELKYVTVWLECPECKTLIEWTINDTEYLSGEVMECSECGHKISLI
jgi:DNA-directed RNA polymerase subunit RPC12/RpoP